MAQPATNLRTLKPCRRAPEPGDLFVMVPPDDQFLFGRVIRTDALGPMNAVLIYVYSRRSTSNDVPDDLTPQSLLIPPVFTNRLGWVHGRFETIENVPLTSDAVLPRHCFYAAGRYYDDDGETLPQPTEPCGRGGVTSYRMLDDAISDALGIDRIPT